MDARTLAAWLLIAGSATFLVGAAVGVPRVFTERDPAVRLRLLDDRPAAWRSAQPLYALGPFVAAVGVGCLAAGSSRDGRGFFAAACGALVLGAVPWAWATRERGRRVRAFAYGELPGWPFAVYVLLTIAGLALLGVALIRDSVPAWLGWLTLGADGVFLVGYLAFRDIPPFVFYLLLMLIGVVLLL